MLSAPSKYFYFKGRVALYAILEAMNIRKGDEIVIPGFTCVVVPNAISYLGARPVYVDIDRASYNIDPTKIEERISNNSKAIIAQHTFGIPAEMDEINRIAEEYGLTVIEDSCHAIGAKYKGRSVGTLGDASFFSSQWSKPITTGLGGWALINDSGIAKQMEGLYDNYAEPHTLELFMLRLQSFAYTMLLRPSLFWFAQSTYRALYRRGLAVGSSSCEELECKEPQGYKKRMSSWQKSLLERRLGDIDRAIAHRKHIAETYRAILRERGHMGIELPEYLEEVFLRFPLIVEEKERILERARRARIELGDWFVSPVHPNLEGWEKVGYERGMCPIAEDICQKIINLPTHLGISEKEAERILGFTLGD